MSSLDTVLSLRASTLFAALNRHSPQQLQETLEGPPHNIGNYHEVFQSALLSFASYQSTPDYFHIRKPLSDRQVEQILDLFTHLEKPYIGENFLKFFEKLKTNPSTPVKKRLLDQYVIQLLRTMLVSSRTSSYLLLQQMLNIPLENAMGLALKKGNVEIIERQISEFSDLNNPQLSEALKRRLLRKLNHYCCRALQHGTFPLLWPILETALPGLAKDALFLSPLINEAVRYEEVESVELLISKAAKSEVLFATKDINVQAIATLLRRKEKPQMARDDDLKSSLPALDLTKVLDEKGVANLQSLNGQLLNILRNRMSAWSINECRTILSLFFSSQEWAKLTPLAEIEKDRLMTILNSSRGSEEYKLRCILNFVKLFLPQAIGISHESVHLLRILWCGRLYDDKFFKKMARLFCLLNQSEMLRTFIDVCGNIHADRLIEWLSIAVAQEDLEMVKMLVEEGGNAIITEEPENYDFNEDSNFNSSALCKAAALGTQEIFNYLFPKIQNSIRIDKRWNKHIPMNCVTTKYLLDFALRGGNDLIIDSLTNQEFPVTGTYIDQCIKAIRSGNCALVGRYLSKIADPNQLPSNNRRFLYEQALNSGNYDMLLTLARETRIDFQRGMRCGALKAATSAEDPRILSFYFPKIKEAVTSEDLTVMLSAAIKEERLHNASFLLDQGATVQRNHLNRAIKKRNFQLFRLLMKHFKGSLITKDKRGWTLLHSAVDYGKEAILAYLLTFKEVHESGLIYAENKEKETAFQMALGEGNAVMVELFLSHDPNLEKGTYVRNEKAAATAAALLEALKSEKGASHSRD